MSVLKLTQIYLRPLSRVLSTSRVVCLSQVDATAAADNAKQSDQSITLDKTPPPHIKTIVDQIAQLKFYEVNLLNQVLKKELNIPDVQRVAATQVPSEDDVQATTAGVKTAYTVKLVKFDAAKKVALIKEIKKLVEGINLVEAKRFVEECPRVVKANITKDEAEALQKQLETAGAEVKLE